MADDGIQNVVKFLTDVWRETGKTSDAEEIRRWIQPHVATVAAISKDKNAVELLKKISAEAFPEGSWQPVIALNQILFLGKISENPESFKEMGQTFLKLWEKQPLNLSALLVAWRKRQIGSKLDPNIILETLEYDPSAQSYFDPEISAGGVEFFMNIYKDELGVDVDALSESVSKIVGEDAITDFFRLVDIDAPVAPEEFVKRVEKAVEVLATAKEQGLDVREILRKWDELADQGGMRLEKLPAAVKAVAEKAVRERFWEGFIAKAGKLRVPIIDDGAPGVDLLEALQSKGFVKISGADVEFDKDLDALLDAAVRTLMKVSPSAIYTSSDLVEMIMPILERARDKKTAVAAMEVLASASLPAVKGALERNVLSEVVDAVSETVVKAGVRKEEFAEALGLALREGKEDMKKAIIEKIHQVKER